MRIYNKYKAIGFWSGTNNHGKDCKNTLKTEYMFDIEAVKCQNEIKEVLPIDGQPDRIIGKEPLSLPGQWAVFYLLLLEPTA